MLFPRLLGREHLQIFRKKVPKLSVGCVVIYEDISYYQGTWIPQMDRCWVSDDGYQVMSRLINTEWGKVEHATITRLILRDKDILLALNGMGDIPWSVKQEIKNELFGIHPTKDKQARTIQRGCPNDPTRLIENYKKYEEEHKNGM